MIRTKKQIKKQIGKQTRKPIDEKFGKKIIEFTKNSTLYQSFNDFHKKIVYAILLDIIGVIIIMMIATIAFSHLSLQLNKINLAEEKAQSFNSNLMQQADLTPELMSKMNEIKKEVFTELALIVVYIISYVLILMIIGNIILIKSSSIILERNIGLKQLMGKTFWSTLWVLNWTIIIFIPIIIYNLIRPKAALIIIFMLIFLAIYFSAIFYALNFITQNNYPLFKRTAYYGIRNIFGIILSEIAILIIFYLMFLIIGLLSYVLNERILLGLEIILLLGFFAWIRIYFAKVMMKIELRHSTSLLEK